MFPRSQEGFSNPWIFAVPASPRFRPLISHFRFTPSELGAAKVKGNLLVTFMKFQEHGVQKLFVCDFFGGVSRNLWVVLSYGYQ